MSQISIRNLVKNFDRDGGAINVIDKLSLDIKEHEFVVFFGPNGCGKTTLLYLIAKVHKPDSGNIKIESLNKEVGFVFQNYSDSLFPWRTVSKNIEFGLEIKNIEYKKKKQIVDKVLKKLNLTEHKNNYPYQLSGGQNQLTAIGRAIAYNPDLFLLDEPFSSLDYQTTRKMWIELLKIWGDLKKTTLFVSHSIDEAVFLADRVIVLSKRPCKIIGEVKINLPRPRNLGMLKEKNFFKLRNKVLKYFEEGLK